MELTKDQIRRQDLVDNMCNDLLVYLANGKKVEWDMENIGEVRDVV